MPVATLRIWEQRHQAVRPSTTDAGHRLYSLDDVQRIVLLRQLTEQGHAIGSLAALPTPQLQALAAQSAGITQAARLAPARRAAPVRLVVVGQALAERLQRPAIARQADTALEVVAVFATLAQAARAARGQPADVLIVQSPGLQASVAPELSAARQAWAVRQVAVVYRFAGAAARKAWSDTGAVSLRETPDDQALGAWVASLRSHLPEPAAPASPKAGASAHRGQLGAPASPRRFDDAVLTMIAGLPSASACECPRHLAELLMQIAGFESYSADCANRDAADAKLHAYLQQVAGITRSLLESALDTVARHEGLRLR